MKRPRSYTVTCLWFYIFSKWFWISQLSQYASYRNVSLYNRIMMHIMKFLPTASLSFCEQWLKGDHVWEIFQTMYPSASQLTMNFSWPPCTLYFVSNQTKMSRNFMFYFSANLFSVCMWQDTIRWSELLLCCPLRCCFCISSRSCVTNPLVLTLQSSVCIKHWHPLCSVFSFTWWCCESNCRCWVKLQKVSTDFVLYLT